MATSSYTTEPVTMVTTSDYYDTADLAYMEAQDNIRLPMVVVGCCILVIGTIGNVLAFIILRRKALRVFVTAFLLSILAISDTVCLYLGLLHKLMHYYTMVDYFRVVIQYSCQVSLFFI